MENTHLADELLSWPQGGLDSLSDDLLVSFPLSITPKIVWKALQAEKKSPNIDQENMEGVKKLSDINKELTPLANNLTLFSIQKFWVGIFQLIQTAKHSTQRALHATSNSDRWQATTWATAPSSSQPKTHSPAETS